MKEASGELNLTLITIVAIAAIAGLFAFLWPSIKNTINNKWGETASSMSNVNGNVSGNVNVNVNK